VPAAVKTDALRYAWKNNGGLMQFYIATTIDLAHVSQQEKVL